MIKEAIKQKNTWSWFSVWTRTIDREPHNPGKVTAGTQAFEASVHRNALFDPSVSILSTTVVLDNMFLIVCDKKKQNKKNFNLSKKGFLGSRLDTNLALDVSASRGSKNVIRTHEYPLCLSVLLFSSWFKFQAGSPLLIVNWQDGRWQL